MLVLLQPFSWAAHVASSSISSITGCTVSTCRWMKAWFGSNPRASKTCKELKACDDTASAEPCSLSPWSISTEVPSTPSSSSVNPFYEPQAQCDVSAAVELNSLALLTGYAAVDGLQVAHPLAPPYHVTVNPLFQQISHGYKPASSAVPVVAPLHPINPVGQDNQVMLVTKLDSIDVNGANSSAYSKSNTCKPRRSSSSSSCSSGNSRRSSTSSSSSSTSSSSSMCSTANSSTRSCSSSCATRRASSSSSSINVGACSNTNSQRHAAVTTTRPSSLKAWTAVAARSTLSKPKLQPARQATKNKAAASPTTSQAFNTATTCTIRANSSTCRQPVSRATCKPPAVTKATPPAAASAATSTPPAAASAATITPCQPPAADQEYVVAFGRRIAVPASSRTKLCNTTTTTQTGSTVSSSTCSTEGSASNSRQSGRATGRSGFAPSSSSSLNRSSPCSLTSARSRSTDVTAAAHKAAKSASAARATHMASAAAAGKGKAARWR